MIQNFMIALAYLGEMCSTYIVSLGYQIALSSIWVTEVALRRTGSLRTIK